MPSTRTRPMSLQAEAAEPGDEAWIERQVGCSAHAAVGPLLCSCPDDAHDLGHGVFERAAIGADDDSIIGDAQRRDARLLSRWSRRSQVGEDAPRPRRSRASRPRSAARRRARSSTDTSRYSLRSASGSTTVPMSRPARMMPPAAARSRCVWSRAARTSGWARDRADAAIDRGHVQLIGDVVTVDP